MADNSEHFRSGSIQGLIFNIFNQQIEEDNFENDNQADNWGEIDNNWINSFFQTLRKKDYSTFVKKLDAAQIPINRRMRTGWTSYGGKLKWRQFSMQTLLHLTSAHGDETASKILLDRGANPYIQNRDEENCFDVSKGPDVATVLKQWKKDKRWNSQLKWLLVPYFLDENCTLAQLPLEVISLIAVWL